jgi:hypothetical protein
MTITPTSICNQALLRLGAETISSLDDGTRNATLCSRAYDVIRQEILRAHPWNFAMKRVTLSSSVGAPAFEFTKTYTLPTDCLRLWRLYDLSIPYKLEGRTILCDEASLSIIYIYDNEDESTFDPIFREALSLKIAAQLGYAITGSQTPVQLFTQMYDKILKEAKMWDAQENQSDHVEYDSWDTIRRTNSNWNPFIV